MAKAKMGEAPIIIELSYAEASWLKGLLQNPIHLKEPADQSKSHYPETEYESKPRKAIWTALEMAGVRHA
jgi:hypothetical protein